MSPAGGVVLLSGKRWLWPIGGLAAVATLCLRRATGLKQPGRYAHTRLLGECGDVKDMISLESARKIVKMATGSQALCAGGRLGQKHGQQHNSSSVCLSA